MLCARVRACKLHSNPRQWTARGERRLLQLLGACLASTADVMLRLVPCDCNPTPIGDDLTGAGSLYGMHVNRQDVCIRLLQVTVLPYRPPRSGYTQSEFSS